MSQGTIGGGWRRRKTYLISVGGSLGCRIGHCRYVLATGDVGGSMLLFRGGNDFPWELCGRFCMVSRSIGLAMEPKSGEENRPVKLGISVITPIIWRFGSGT
jgi:hypothetical protein